MAALRAFFDRVDDVIGASTFGRVFRLEGSGHVSHRNQRCRPRYIQVILTIFKAQEIKNTRFLREVRAGLTTFFTMAYIIAVNVSIRPFLDQRAIDSHGDRPRS